MKIQKSTDEAWKQQTKSLTISALNIIHVVLPSSFTVICDKPVQKNLLLNSSDMSSIPMFNAILAHLSQLYTQILQSLPSRERSTEKICKKFNDLLQKDKIAKIIKHIESNDQLLGEFIQNVFNKLILNAYSQKTNVNIDVRQVRL